MKFEEVLPLMGKGRKIRLGNWGSAQYIELDCIGEISDQNGASYDLNNEDILSLDWEIFEEPKWEPEDGSWLIDATGSIVKFGTDTQAYHFGTKRLTREQAKVARDKMRVFNRLLAYVDENSREGEKQDSMIYLNYKNIWRYASVENSPTIIAMSKRVAKQLCDDLNNGRVEL